MRSYLLRLTRQLFPIALLFALFLPGMIWPQEKVGASKPIDIDKELQPRVPTDRAQSYYHYSLSKWYEESGDFARALSEMRQAARYNESSSTLRVELANALVKSGNIQEAVEECEEAKRLDAKNPEAYWLLGSVYSSYRDRAAGKDSLKKAVKELEAMREVAPEDERPHFALGRAYFELNEPEKAIQSYEKFQSLRLDTDAGFGAIADYYQRQGNYEKAIEYLSKALKSYPQSAKSMMMLASLYAKVNKHKEAIPLYRKILTLAGDNLELKRQLGASLVSSGEYEEAIQVLQQVVEISPADTFSLTQLGRARLGARQVPKAIESFKAALNANPNNIEAEFYLGNCYEQSGDAAEAIKVFSSLLAKTKNASGERAEEQKADRALFHQHLASSYQELGENEKAIAIYEELVKGDQEPNPHYVFLLINAYRVNRQLDKALALGKEQFEKRSKEPAIALVYARTLADAGKANQGAEILNKLIQSDPANLDLYVNLSQIYIQGKRFSDAEKVLRRAQSLESLREPETERLKFQLAAVYERQKDFDRAESLFKEILKANPDNAGALNYIGYMLADRGVRLEEAVRYVERALGLEPNNGAYLDSLGWAFFKLNELEKAEKYLLQAVTRVKNDPVIHDHLGDLYYKTGNYEKAQDAWNKSVATGTEPDELQKVREKIEKLRETLRKQKRR